MQAVSEAPRALRSSRSRVC